jgi:hypothetical protein
MDAKVIEMLAMLVKEHGLDTKAALEAAWKMGWKEANATYVTRQQQAQYQQQMQGLGSGCR